MKFITTLGMFLLVTQTYAQNVLISYKCSPSSVTPDTSLSAGTNGEITKIKELIIPENSPFANPFTTTLSLVVEGLTMSDMMNDVKTPSEKILKYKIKSMKSGTLLELKNHSDNEFEMDAVFLEYGNIDVDTAGPIPEGTHHQIISMAFIDSNLFYTNPSPMTVKKIVFDCQTTVKY